jgi:hypothetical protein
MNVKKQADPEVLEPVYGQEELNAYDHHKL